MLFPVIGTAVLAIGVHAAPHAQNIPPPNFLPELKLPQGPPIIGDVISEILEYDAVAALERVPAAVPTNVTIVKGPTRESRLNPRSLGDCAVQPVSPYTGPLPNDDPDSFLSFPYFAEQSLNAEIPVGYSPSFNDYNAANNALDYMGFTRFAVYNTTKCAAQCNRIRGCLAFNIYFERDPTLDAGADCSNPPSQTNVKCVFWGGEVNLDNALNYGQYRDECVSWLL